MRSRAAEIWGFWRFIAQRFIEDRCIGSAASLTYTTLFAVVPVMTVAFVVISAIPAFRGVGEQIQSFVFSNFVPSTGETVQQYLGDFIRQARQLTWVGVLLLAVTAYTMLVTIEQAFNTIWRVRKPRRGIASFLLYWAMLSLGPLLLGAGFAASTYITSLALLSGPDAIEGAKELLAFMPLLCSVAAFTLLYATVPNAKVRLLHAFLGGAFTAVLFEAAKALFALYVSYFPGYQLIYGAFASVPLFLLWIYVSWVIVLLGAELACNLGYNHVWRRRALSPLLVAFAVLRLFQQRQQQGTDLCLSDVRKAGWKLSVEEWNQLLNFFEAQQLICATAGGSWVLCRDLKEVRVQQLLENSPWPLPWQASLPEELQAPWSRRFEEDLACWREQGRVWFDLDLASWLQQGTDK